MANPLYVKFLNADLTLPSGTTKEDVMKFMRGVFWLLEQHKKKASAAKRKAKADAKAIANAEHVEPPEPPAAARAREASSCRRTLLRRDYMAAVGCGFCFYKASKHCRYEWSGTWRMRLKWRAISRNMNSYQT